MAGPPIEAQAPASHGHVGVNRPTRQRGLLGRARASLRRVWVVAFLSVFVVAGLLAILVAAVLTGRDRVEETRASGAVATISGDALDALHALNSERAHAELALLEQSARQRDRYEGTFVMTDSTLQELRRTWVRQRPLLPDSGPSEFNDFFIAAGSIDDIRGSTLDVEAEASFATYTSVVEPLSIALTQLLGINVNPSTIPERQALTALVQATGSLEARRALVSRALGSNSPLTEEQLIQLDLQNQNIRLALSAARSLTGDETSALIEQARNGPTAVEVNEMMNAVTSTEPSAEPPTVATWFRASSDQIAIVSETADSLSAALAERAAASESQASMALWLRWLLLGPLVLVSGVMAASAIHSSRERIFALSEYNKIATGLMEWFQRESIAEMPGTDVAARYRPSSEQTSAGGDWYDVYEIESRKLSLVIGDVAGHGPQAAAHMAELQHLLRGQSTARPLGPAAQLDLLDRSRSHPSIFATLIYGILDVDRGTFLYSRAGHVPVCIIGANGSFQAHEGGGGPPVGAELGVERAEDLIRLQPGDIVMLMTDGLIEMRSKDIDAGLESLASSISDATDGIEGIADALMPPESEGHWDDVAFMLVQWKPGS